MVHGLMGLVLFLVISVIRDYRSTGRCIHVNRGILGVFVPKGRVFVLILRDNQNPDDIYKWHASHTMYTIQNVLHLVKYLHGGGNVQGQGDIFGLLVLGSPVVLILLLLLQEAGGL
jgi:hypothetical protein